jgi:AraC-like DNA-binding protein
VSAIEIARRLAVSAQTLRRRLAEDGTSVRAISADVRHAAAVESLQRGDEPIAKLSERLGYSEQSAFVRAFVSWTGVTPAAFRRARRA